MNFLSSCTTTAARNRLYCKNINTYKKGRLDVSKGKTDKSFYEEVKHCSKYGVQLNEEQYKKGRTKELEILCTYDKGYKFGLKGKTYLNICPEKSAEAFLKGYRTGDKKCLYESGHFQAMKGKKSSFPNSKCLNLSKDKSEKEYVKGWTAGLKTFCSYERGYEFGLNEKKYLDICPRDNSVDFLKGYKAGDKKCSYELGYSQAMNGKKPSFSTSGCLKLSVTQSRKEYVKGRAAGLKMFCTYNKGHEFGMKSKKYLYTCPKKSSEAFLKGYRAGDRKCLYESGYSQAVAGGQDSFSASGCLKLSKTQSQREYTKGRNAGLKVFCTYRSGYNLGLNNDYYQNICPKKLEPNFFKGYTLGLQEYKADQRQKELLAIEQARIAVERERTQQMWNIEQEKIAAEKERTQQLLDIEKQRIRGQENVRRDLLNSQMQRCEFNSDCQEDGYCRYNFRLKDHVCKYD